MNAYVCYHVDVGGMTTDCILINAGVAVINSLRLLFSVYETDKHPAS